MPENNEKNKSPQRWDAENVLRFDCSPGVPCFTRCCQDVTIALTPYDVLRLKNALRISSSEFLDKYAIMIPKEKRLIPLVILKMNKEDKRCPFVTDQGCSVYADRPWSCRMYPLDMDEDGTFHLIAEESRCLGLQEKQPWRIGDWLVEQGIIPFDEMNSLFAEITAPLQAQDLAIDNPKINKMVFMALYNLDRFRDFVFSSTFLERFEVEPARIEKIKRKDDELLKFAFDWIKFGIFGQILFKVKPEAAESQS